MDEREDDSESIFLGPPVLPSMSHWVYSAIALCAGSLDGWLAGLCFPTAGSFTRLLFYSIGNAVFRAVTLGTGTYMIDELWDAHNRD